MNTTLISEQNQTSNFDKMGIINEYLLKLTIGTLLNRSGITKTKGATPLAIFTALFNLSFSRVNLFQGIVKNKEIQVDKDAVYNFLNSSTYNWRRFTLLLFRKIYFVIKKLLNNSKKVELLSRVFDHTHKKYTQVSHPKRGSFNE